MASLTRLQLSRRLVSRPPSSLSLILTVRSTQAFRGVRTIQTSADTTQLHSTAPSDPAQPFTVRLHEESFRSYLCDTPELDVEVTKDKLLTMYKQMQLARRMEMAADALYKAKLIRGFCHLAIGQVRSSRFVFFSFFLYG